MGVITRVAGTGVKGNTGDGLLATEARLNEPSGVAVTADGGFLIADTENHVVRMVRANGWLPPMAGTGAAENSGDGGLDIDARLNSPAGVAVTADTQNHEVRMVSAAGVITRVAGTGAAGISGDGGPATSAQLVYPMGVAV